MKKMALMLVLVMCFALTANAVTLIGPGVNNGSFELPAGVGHFVRPDPIDTWQKLASASGEDLSLATGREVQTIKDWNWIGQARAAIPARVTVSEENE